MIIKKFGIELRKIGDTESLYKEVDVVLAKSGLMDGLVGAPMQLQTVAHSLQKMFSVDNWFSVCTIKDCAELCQILIPKERMTVYSAIHCMKWNEMLPEYRQMVVAMVLDDFRPVLNNKQ